MKCKNINLNIFIIALISLNFIYSSIANINVKGNFYEENKFNFFEKYNFREKESISNQKNNYKLKGENKKKKKKSKVKINEQFNDKNISRLKKENLSFKKKKYSYEKKLNKIQDDKFKHKNNGPIQKYSSFTNDYLTEDSEKKQIHNDKLNLEKNNKSGFRRNINNNRSNIKFTLPSIEIDKEHKIDYYYPFFYRTHLIEYQEIIDNKDLSNECSDLGCNWCDIKSRNYCYECRHGFFLFQESCYTVCPQNHYADIFKKKCIPIDSQSKLKIWIYYIYYYLIKYFVNKINFNFSSCGLSNYVFKSFYCWFLQK